LVTVRQKLEVRLTPAQTLRMERMGEALWPTEKQSTAEVTRRLALTQLLWHRADDLTLGQRAQHGGAGADLPAGAK
jgi:hypothetical protein